MERFIPLLHDEAEHEGSLCLVSDFPLAFQSWLKQLEKGNGKRGCHLGWLGFECLSG